ncbi:hypothetical protein PG326_06105 [Riemerella anatipestifer]|nr:hypothetical protein [Riemerella anatipestifer]MDY3357903.1 hypothetical protein [Riemerella anatipestifer]
MKTTTTKLSVLAFLGLGLAVYGQSGKVGVNISSPRATLDVQPNATNSKDDAKTNEGILAPKLSKTRVASIEAPVEGTLVYVIDDAAKVNGTINAYKGTDPKVAKITEKGYYYYNGTEWVKTSTGSFATDNIWVNDASITAVKVKNLSDGLTARTDDKNVFITDDGNVGIGVKNAWANIQINGKVGGNAEILLSRFTETNDGANLALSKSGGTPESPTVPSIGSTLANFRAATYTGGGDGSNNQTSSGWDGFASNIETVVAGVPNTNGTLPTNMLLTVTDNSSGFRKTLLKLQGSSGVGVGFAKTEDIKARLQINDWNDVSLTSTNNAFMIGRENTSNLVMDGNEIMARNNGQTSGLSLQAQGGDLFVNTEDADITKRFYFRSNTGNLGLGVTTPTEKLEVAGNVKATGFIGANASIFPDYVFQKYYTGTSNIKADYSFKTLSQVEDFVKTNGHLPGYQSAAEIKKQGYVDLMATQLTNVEKIEELYLHSIEQDKALKAKDAEIKELKERLSKIETLLSK